MPHRVRDTAEDAAAPGKCLPRSSCRRAGVSALAGVAPGVVPVLARSVDDAAVGLEKPVGHLEDCEHQAAFGTPCDVAAALFAPDELAGLAFDAFGRAFLV